MHGSGGVGGDVAAVRLSRPVLAVVRAMARAHPAKTSAPDLARRCQLDVTTVERALRTLCRARLVQYTLQDQVPDRPPHRVWWAGQAGRDLARAHSTPHGRAAVG